MRIAIYGAGSLGTVLGAYLARSGLAVDLVSHNRAHIEALQERGAHVTGMVDFTVPVSAMLPEQMGSGYDVIFLMTKSIGNDGTVSFLAPRLSGRGIICTCQNGLPEEGIARIIGSGRTYGCTIGWGATYIGPGVSELTSGEETFTFTLGSLSGGTDGNLVILKSILSRMGTAGIDQDFIGSRWSKLLINASFSAVSAVTGCTFGEAASAFRSRRIIQGILSECAAVAKAKGIRFAPMQGKDVSFIANAENPLHKLISFMLIPIAMRRHRNLKSSMLQDIEKGRRTEIDAIDGALSLEGRRAGVPTPITDRTIWIVHGITEGRLVPSMENLALYKE